MPVMTEHQTESRIAVGAIVAFDSIREPGTYVCNWSGYLIRVPGEGFTPARQAMLNIIGPQPLFVTKISENPYVSVSEARRLVESLGLKANF